MQIKWGPETAMYGGYVIASEQPPGYTLCVVYNPYKETQTMQGCFSKSSSSGELLAIVKNVDRHDVEAKKKAGRAIKAACLAHAEATAVPKS